MDSTASILSAVSQSIFKTSVCCRTIFAPPKTYKQRTLLAPLLTTATKIDSGLISAAIDMNLNNQLQFSGNLLTVSYTHLTMPTKA